MYSYSRSVAIATLINIRIFSFTNLNLVSVWIYYQWKPPSKISRSAPVKISLMAQFIFIKFTINFCDYIKYHITAMFGNGKVWQIIHDSPNLNQQNFNLVSLWPKSVHSPNFFAKFFQFGNSPNINPAKYSCYTVYET